MVMLRLNKGVTVIIPFILAGLSTYWARRCTAKQVHGIIGREKGRTTSNTVLFVSGSKAGRGAGVGGGRGGTNKGKLDSREGSK